MWGVSKKFINQKQFIFRPRPIHKGQKNGLKILHDCLFE